MNKDDARHTNVNDNTISNACQGRSASQRVDRTALNGAHWQLQQHILNPWQELTHKLCVRLDTKATAL